MDWIYDKVRPLVACEQRATAAHKSTIVHSYQTPRFRTARYLALAYPVRRLASRAMRCQQHLVSPSEEYLSHLPAHVLRRHSQLLWQCDMQSAALLRQGSVSYPV